MPTQVDPTPGSLLVAAVVRDETMRKGWSIRQLEQRTERSHDAVMRLLRGASNVGPAVLRPIERELDMPTPFLSYVRDGDVERLQALSGVRPDLLQRVLRELGVPPRNRRRDNRAG